MHRKFTSIFLVVILLLGIGIARAEVNLDRLSQEDIQKEEAVLAKLEPLVKERLAKGTAPLLTFDEIYQPLNEEEREFLKIFLNLDAKKLGVVLPYRGFARPGTKFIPIKGQRIKDVKAEGNKTKIIGCQYLPDNVYRQYRKMNKAMRRDIHRTLFVDSGYRSAAYQLYLFAFYLRKHDYSVRETAKLVAIAGYSEHGAPDWQAIDFVNIDGVNEDNPGAFENLAEYKWLMKHAAEYGFALSYPRNNPSGISFEPWHWRYEGVKNKMVVN
ncbi:MAG: M15 family metallopeptidase [Candidatus Omnitrophica bacterium]|nr:M15 family metallopeptidase [Candidatus Omnitrophota bacterium]